MRSGRVAACLVGTALYLASAVEAGAAGVPRLTVIESAGLGRRSQPVTIGVPLPRGWLPASGVVRVGELPTQTRPLARWADGSVRWLLVDFQTDLAARAKKSLELRKGAPPPAASKVSVQPRGAGIAVDAGALRLIAGKESGGLLRIESVGGKPFEGGPLRAEVVSGGVTSPAAAPDEVEIEERGPLRAALTLRGRYTNGFTYELRLEAFAGRPFVRLLHTLINTRPEPQSMLERIALTVPAKLAGEVVYHAAVRGAASLTTTVGETAVGLEQLDADTLHVGGASRPGRLEGWFTLESRSASLGLEAPFFWQEFPEAVRFSKQGLTYELHSAGDRPLPFGVGAAKTHELYLVVGRGRDLVAEPGRGVTAAVDPTWTADSGALLNAVDPRREAAFVGAVSGAFDRVMKSVDEEIWDETGTCAGTEGKVQEVRRRGFYGMLNWGDWNFRGYHDTTKGCDAWGNQEYDLTQVLGLLFAATERPEVGAYFTAAARHFADVDRIHFQPQHPEWVGMNHPKNPQHFSFELGGVDLGHTWVEGLFTHHFMTGEGRSLAAAIGISDYLSRRLRSTLKGNPRQFGWPALALAAAFEATGKEMYRSASLQYAQQGIAAHRVPEKVGKDWKLGILADGVTYAHAVTGDARLRAWLLDYAGAVMRSQPRDIRYYPALAYTGRLSGSLEMQEAARAAAARIEYGDWAKPFSIGARTGFRILGVLDSRVK